MMFAFVSPLEIVNQTVVLIVVCVIVALMIRHWDKVMVAVTGDDRLHGTVLDLIYFLFFQCCGTCTGDWTRSWTRRCCCCCGDKIRGINLVTEVGRLLGITTCTVELKNIICGDLPWDQRADFYISVECAANPPMVTSLAEEKLPKVVHFPEVITLRLRWSPLEERVRITVKELNLFGSTDLCEVHIPAMSVIDWASSSQNERMKRFEMKPTDPSYPSETPPWILLEFGTPHDERDLDRFHGRINTVRTSTSDGHFVDRPMRDFKQEYTLLDNTGHVLQEPFEDDLQAIACRAWLVSTLQYGFMCWGAFLLVTLGFLRVWVGLCYRRYKHVTMALMNNQTFPMSDYELGSFVNWCHASVDGEGQPFGVPCKPSFQQVLSVCKSDEEGGRYPKNQPPVLAFEGMIKRTGFDTGLPCGATKCHLNKAFQDYDVYAPIVIAVYLLLICGIRICGNSMVRAKKYSLQHIRAKQTREYYEYASTRGGRRGGTSWLSAA